MSRYSIALIWTCLALMPGGCTHQPGYEHATVSGTVTVDGNLVPKGSITFSPVRAGQGPVVGGSIAEGQYRLERVPVGKLRVTFVAQSSVPREFTDATGTKREVPVNILPPQYRDGVPIEVTTGECTRDFALISQQHQP